MTTLTQPIRLSSQFALAAGSAFGYSNLALDATTDEIRAVLPVVHADTYTHVLIRQVSVTGTPGTLRVSLQGLDASGNPDGTILGGGNAYANYTPVSGNNNTIVALALTASVSLSAGQEVAIVLDPFSGTWDGSNSATFSSRINNGPAFSRTPWVTEVNAGTPTRTNVVAPVGLRSATRTIGWPYQQTTATSGITSATTPDEVGCAFTLPTDIASSVQVGFVEWYGRCDTAGGTYDLVIYQGTTAIHTESGIDMDWLNATNAEGPIHVPLSAWVTLNTGTEYIVAIRPTSTNTIRTRHQSFASVQDRNAVGDFANNWVQRTDAGAWTATTTQSMAITLGIVGWEIPAGGGGGGGQTARWGGGMN